MSFTVANANTYFDGHVQKRAWAGYSVDEQTAALTHAERLVRRAVGVALTTDASEEGDAPRHDLAVYEQALYLLRNGPNTPEGGAPAFVAMDQGNPGRPREQDTGLLCPEARRWLIVPRANGTPAPFVELFRG